MAIINPTSAGSDAAPRLVAIGFEASDQCGRSRPGRAARRGLATPSDARSMDRMRATAAGSRALANGPGVAPPDALRDPSRANDGFHQRIAGEPVGAMQPGTADLTACPQAVHRAAAFAVHGDAAHVIVRRGPDRNRIGRGIDPGHPAERADDGIALRKILARMFPRVEENAMSLRRGGAIPRARRCRAARVRRLAGRP